MEFDRRPNGADFHNNINNGRISRKSSMPSANGSMVFCSANEISSATNSNPSENNTAEENLTEEEIKQQTRKVVEAFLRTVLARNASAERVQRNLRQQPEPKRSASAPVSDNFRHKPKGQRPVPQQVPLKESPDEVLQKVMNGVLPESYRHRSNVSVGSSDSYDSGGKTGRFQRSKSFSKAQRHSVVTELENRGTKTPDSRRCSVDTSTPSKRRDDFYGATESDGGKVGSSSGHAHAISDPVSMTYDVSVKTSSEIRKDKEEKKKGGFWKKFMSKKKEGRKSKEDTKTSSHLSDIVSEAQQKEGRQSKAQGERHTVSRESSLSITRRTTPSPPSSPKGSRRTPNLLRRRLSKRKKTPKSESPPREERSQSLEFDKVLDDDKYTSNGDSKSNSLPMSVNLGTHSDQTYQHPPSVHNRRYRPADHGTVVDGHKFKPHPPSQNRRDSADIMRPTTLNIPKKKPSAMKKLRKMMRLDSSSSSDEAFEDSLKSSSYSSSSRMGQGDPFNRSSLPNERKPSQVKHSESDRPTNDSIRDRYQHRASKSMSDMDQCTEIADKLRRLAEHYGHIMAQRHSGHLDRRTQTPDAYGSRKKHTHGVNRAMSLTTGSSTLQSVPTHSLKAFYNLHPSHRNRADEGMENNVHRRRITRDQISHRPTGSLDSPHGNRAESGHGWTARIEHERLLNSAAQDKKTFRSSSAAPPPPRPAESPRRRASPRLPPPPPTQSSSPTLRASHIRTHAAGQSGGQVVPDSVEPTVERVQSHHLPITGRRLQHREIHKTVTKTSKSNGVVHQEVKTVDEIDDVEADALPFGETSQSNERPTTPDFSSGFHETVHSETLRTTASGSEIREVFDEELDERTIMGHTAQTEEVDMYASAAAHPRPRAATTPAASTDFSDGEGGAAGGKNPDIDEDKLVLRIAEALCKRGDKYNVCLDQATPVLDDAIMGSLQELSIESLKSVLTRVLSTVTEFSTSSAVTHPEVVQLAMIFNTAEVVIRACMQPSSIAQSLMSALSQNFINPIVQRIGGWGRVQSSLDETERELNTLEEDEPSTSGAANPRQTQSPDTEDEID